MLLTAAVALATAGALAAPSSAGSSGAFADPRGDLFGTTDSSSDIVRISFGHSGGRIVHTVGLAGNAPNPASQQVPRLYINPSNRANGTSECGLFVGRHRGRLGVFVCGYANRIASARIERTSARTIRYSFTPGAIGNPRSYEWAAVTAATNTDTGGAYRADRAPSSDSTFHTHTLR
jgi:hypothetical protein